MSLWRTLELICLKKANQATRGVKIIWAFEIGKIPNKEDIRAVEDLFRDNKVEDLTGSYSYVDELIPPKKNLPGDLKELLDMPSISPKLKSPIKWKRYFNFLVSYYLNKADEFDRMESGGY